MSPVLDMCRRALEGDGRNRYMQWSAAAFMRIMRRLAELKVVPRKLNLSSFAAEGFFICHNGGNAYVRESGTIVHADHV
ncbi:hypothetical protein J27TS7_15650 [Paenibacillus dendritiformis]|nr:hypothetical protein J27TS7_15650 [Paenibacillus dendritiformis]